MFNLCKILVAKHYLSICNIDVFSPYEYDFTPHKRLAQLDANAGVVCDASEQPLNSVGLLLIIFNTLHYHLNHQYWVVLN